MASSMSVVFSGEDINEINAKILDHVADLKATVEEAVAAPAKAKPASKKKAASAKRKAKPAVEPDESGVEDLLPADDGFGEEPETGGANGEDPESGFGDDEDLLPPEEGATSIEDVRDVLGKLSKMGHEEVAQKVLKRFGKCEDLDGLAEEDYQAVVDATNTIIAKVESGK